MNQSINMLSSNEIRSRFLEFFKNQDHVMLPSTSLIPSETTDTNATLFNIAGVQPLVPYILAGEHPAGARLASAQKCVRTKDLDEVGDNTHATFFEMLGNWSIGNYFKTEAIEMSFEFLTDTEKGLGLDINRLYVTIFAGDERAPRDEEAFTTWKRLFESKGLDASQRIFEKVKDNWWEAGDSGPCGPSTEMFYDVLGKHNQGLSQEDFEKFEEAQDIVEIWNDVFMQFEKRDGKVVGELSKKVVDTGSGLERVAMVLQGKDNIFDTDLFSPIMDVVRARRTLESESDVRAARIIADHIKTAMFMIADGVVPDNKDRGYILRRIIRRAVRFLYALDLHESDIDLFTPVFEMYGEVYGELIQKKDFVIATILEEKDKFMKTLDRGMKEFEKGERDAFILFTTYGFPLEMTQELAKEKSEEIDIADFEQKMKEHQETSRSAAVGKFKGGLEDHSPETIKLHTAHHLVLAALQKHVSPDIKQRGSNITAKRLRIDFNFDRKLTDEEKSAVENQVNEWIDQNLGVTMQTMSLEQATALGAEMEFGAKYPDEVSVYFIENIEGEAVSKEFCGGPHVAHTGELGHFRIKKEESSSAGVRRIKGVLE